MPQQIESTKTKKAFEIYQYSTEIERYHPAYKEGLTTEQVEARTAAKLTNEQEEDLTPSVSQIIRKNTITLFNAINLILAIAIIVVGKIENTLFMGVVFCNAIMGIWQEIRSKRTLDKLSVLAQAKVSVVRDGRLIQIDQQQVVLDEVIYLKAGEQVCADTEVIAAKGLEADESLLTGETDRIKKEPGDIVVSGSYITAGAAYVRAAAVGRENYANSLAKEAKQSKENKSRLLFFLNKIIQVVTITIIPMGLLLIWSNVRSGQTIQTAVLGTAAAIVGMIPSGLVLLTSITLTVGAMTLAKRKALVQSLPSIETLARADVICLDKTGTITDGTLKFEKIITEDIPEEEIKQAVSNLMGTLSDSNATAEALTGAFGKEKSWTVTDEVSFSSDRKWSGASYAGKGSYILGAPNILFAGKTLPLLDKANACAAEGYRVLAVAFSEDRLATESLPDNSICIGLILLSDNVRANARETFQHFVDEGVELKVISGDNPITVSHVAGQAGIPNHDKVKDMYTVTDQDDYCALVRDYTIFGHVHPEQKQKLIRALQEEGHTTCMTGDGVNDILAMRESDCSVAMVSGSPAARSACDFVLMTSDFGAMTYVLQEGRRVINNIEKVASLYLVNTVYSMLLIMIYSLLPYAYPYVPIQMTPINMLAVGIPGFVIALQRNYTRPQNRLLINIFEHAMPAALTIVFNTLYIQMASILFDIPFEQSSSMIVFLIGAVGIYLLNVVIRPFTTINKVMFVGIVVCMVGMFVFLGDYFMYDGLFSRNIFFYIPLVYFSYQVHDWLGKMNHRLVKSVLLRRKKRAKIK